MTHLAARKASTLREVQVSVGGGETKIAIESLAGDNDSTDRREQTRLAEEGDGVVWMADHD